MKQMTIWDLMSPDTDDLSECMKHPMYEGGKIRIFALYKHERDKRKRAKFLAKEYGLGGRSYTLKNGKHGFVDYNGKGVKISSFKDSEEHNYTWKEAENAIQEMINKGQYMTDEDMERWNRLPETPYPVPCYRYP